MTKRFKTNYFKQGTKKYNMLRSFIKRCIPKLDPNKHKGQCGRIAVLGGSETYVGAPYYAAYAALISGADLLYLFTATEAASAIKSFSPELMVEPVYSCLDTTQSPDSISEPVVSKLNRIHALCIGPGLGRHEHVFNGVKKIIMAANKIDLPTVIDADGLFLVTHDLDLIRGQKNVVLTPNIIEFKRLCKALDIDEPANNIELKDLLGKVESVAEALGNVNVILKGGNDIISNGNWTEFTTEIGGLRRSGGKGDILAGLITLACGWASIADADGAKEKYITYKNGLTTELEIEGDDEHGCDEYYPYMWALYFGSTVAKRADRLAFNEKGRGMTTPDMFKYLGQVVEQLCPSPKM